MSSICSERKTSWFRTTLPLATSTTATATRNGWCGAASHGRSSNQPRRRLPPSVKTNAQMDVPAVGARPADQLPGLDDVAHLDQRVDVLVSEVARVHAPAHAARRCRGDVPALECVDLVRPSGRRPELGTIVAGSGLPARTEAMVTSTPGGASPTASSRARASRSLQDVTTA